MDTFYTPHKPEIGDLLLSLYECLTDSNQFEYMMDMVTSWLDHEDAEILTPLFERHADKVWRLFSEVTKNDFLDSEESTLTHSQQFDQVTLLTDAIAEHLNADDLGRLHKWLSTQGHDEDFAPYLVIRIYEDLAEHPAIAIVTRLEQSPDQYSLERTTTTYEVAASKFIANSFQLTTAEFAIVRELIGGGTLRAIAGRLGKSLETVRSQVKSVTGKLGVGSQLDVLRLVNQAAHLMPRHYPNIHSATKSTGVRRIQRPDGRTIEYEIDGPPSSKSLLFCHACTLGRHWPERAIRHAQSRGWRIIRVSRAGRGGSTLNPKLNDSLLRDHTNDYTAVLNEEKIDHVSIFGAADGFPIGYQFALENPDRVSSIVGQEVTPPVLSRHDAMGLKGGLRTLGLASLYAPGTIKFMVGVAMKRMAKMTDRYSGIHPLFGVNLRDFEDEDGISTDDRNFRDMLAHKGEGTWRDISYTTHDWAYAPPNANHLPRSYLLHSKASFVISPGPLDILADRIGATIHRIDHFLPMISSTLPGVLDLLESNR